MKLEEIRKLIDEATPGPWEFCHGSDDGLDHWELWNPETSEHVVQDDSGVEPSTENLRFIASSRTLLPKLLAVAEAAKAAAEDTVWIDTITLNGATLPTLASNHRHAIFDALAALEASP